MHGGKMSNGRLLGGTAVAFLILFSVETFADRVRPADRVRESISIRAQATSQSTLLGTLAVGHSLEYLDSVPRWHRVRLEDGRPGFVSKNWSEVIPDPVAPAQSSTFTLHFLDVGTGDSAIIDMGDREIVIDGGDSIRVLNAYVDETGIIDGPIELVIVTHGDTDHWNGLRRLLGFDGVRDTPFTALEYWDPGYDRDCNPASSGGRRNYLAFVNDIRGAVPAAGFKRPLEDHHSPADVSGTPQPFTVSSLPGVAFTLLHSNKAPATGSCSYKINNASVVLMIEIGGVRLLFTGDANGKQRAAVHPNITPGHVEARLLALESNHPGALKADILKVPHHGSETASTSEYITAVNPRFAVVSASAKHHLPRDTTLDRYAHPSRIILRTDETRGNDNDHILCFQSDNQVECNFSDVFNE